MQSVLEDKLTGQEIKILSAYRNPKSSNLSKQIRLSIQYAIAAAIFLVLAIKNQQPLYSIGVYIIFLLWMFVRLLVARRIVGIMPGIIEKYELEIARLRSHYQCNSGEN
jgi:hypothetical protein